MASLRFIAGQTIPPFNCYNLIDSFFVMENQHPFLSLAILGALFLLAPNKIYAGPGVEVEDFENGLGKWKQSGQVISIQKGGCLSGNNCVLIERTNARDLTVISQQISVPKRGRITISGYVKASNVSVGQKFYERGKFVASLFQDKSECCWKDDDFDGSILDWTERK